MNVVSPIKDKKQLELMKLYLKEKSKRDYLMFMIGISSALRISDILKLKVRDVWDGKKPKEFIFLNEKKTGKYKRFPITDNLSKSIKEYVKEFNPKEEHYLFCSRKGDKPITRQHAALILSRAGDYIGIKEPISTHSMRKTWGIGHIIAGFRLHLLCQLSTIKAMENLFKDTERYITVPNDLLKSTDDNLYDKLFSLIKVLGWDIEVYRFISEFKENELFLLKYLINVLKDFEYEEIKDDLLQLNSDGLLPWSDELISKLDFNDEERITYFKYVSSKVPGQFVLNETSATIPLSSELNLIWSGREANTSYFIDLMKKKEEIDDVVIERAIEEIDYWDIEIFKGLKGITEDLALLYAKKNEEEIELFNISEFSQEEISQLFRNLKPPFNQIGIGNGYNKKFEYDENTLSLMNYLKDDKKVLSKVSCISEKKDIRDTGI